jgi:hypothetical protein
VISLADVARIAQLAAAAASLPASRMERGYRPVALFLLGMTAAGWARTTLAPILVDAPRPRTGLARAAFQLSDALFLAWPAAVAALAIVVFARRKAWPVAVVWAVVVGGLAGAYPALHGEALARWTYGGLTLAACVAGALAFRVWLRQRLAPGPQHTATLLILLSTGATLVGPYLGDVGARWNIARWTFVALYITLSSIGVRQWIRSSSVSRSSSRPPVLH